MGLLAIHGQAVQCDFNLPGIGMLEQAAAAPPLATVSGVAKSSVIRRFAH
jgi:hypothetical protein